MSETTKQLGKYGEPFRWHDNFAPTITVRDRNNHIIATARADAAGDNRRAIERMVNAANAMQGIPDPAKFVEVFGQMREALNKSERELNHVVNVMNRKGGMYEDALVSVRQALAAAKEVTR